jgi:anion-transporting  ArsA/GET3 family ATPase
MAEEKEEKSLERAQKEAEMVSDLAKDARNRREAKKIADKLETAIEQSERKQEDSNSFDSISTIEQQQEHAIESLLDETKNYIRQSTKEAQREIPQYTRMFGDIQEESIKTTREIADDYLESQKQMISIYQSIWTPFLENANSRFWNYYSLSPKGVAETFGSVVSSSADNVIAATKLINNAFSTSMVLFSTALQQTKDNTKEFSRLGVNAIKVFHKASNDNVTIGF